VKVWGVAQPSFARHSRILRDFAANLRAELRAHRLNGCEARRQRGIETGGAGRQQRDQHVMRRLRGSRFTGSHAIRRHAHAIRCVAAFDRVHRIEHRDMHHRVGAGSVGPAEAGIAVGAVKIGDDGGIVVAVDGRVARVRKGTEGGSCKQQTHHGSLVHESLQN
jgi:hypothetical protein